jgi:hypothetical protein
MPFVHCDTAIATLPAAGAYAARMRRLVRIGDTVDRVFLYMPTILPPLMPDAAGLRWSILDLGEAYLDKGRWKLDRDELDDRIYGSSTGFELSFAELSAFAEACDQVIDGLFVGCASSAQFPARSDDDAAILEAADMLVAAFDSSFWLVSADTAVVSRVEDAFHDVSDATPPLSAWDRE